MKSRQPRSNARLAVFNDIRSRIYEFHARYMSGESIEHIAADLDICAGTLDRWMFKDFGLPRRR